MLTCLHACTPFSVGATLKAMARFSKRAHQVAVGRGANAAWLFREENFKLQNGTFQCRLPNMTIVKAISSK